MIGHRVVLRPRSLLETGDLALVLLQRHARLFLRLLPWALVPAIGAWALNAFASWPPLAAILAEVTVLMFSSGVYTILCGDLMLAPTASLRDVQRRFLRSLPKYLMSSVVGVAVVVLSLGFGYGWVAFIPECRLLERGSVRENLSRSAALMKATPGRAAAMLVVMPTILFVGAVAAELIRYTVRAMAALPVLPLTEAAKHISWATFAGIALIQPYIAAYRFLLYIDCRTVREGWDLQVQFSALAAQATQRASSLVKAA
jgi:hypothetical protein